MKQRKTVTLDKEVIEKVDKIRLQERPTLNFSAFTNRALWQAVKEKKESEQK